MRNFARTVYAFAVLTAAAPAAAQAPTTTAFDGTYRGISRQMEAGPFGGSMRSCTLGDGVPGSLIIVNGMARAGSAQNPLEGSVTSHGILIMRNSQGGKFERQIDGQGQAVGRATFGCT